MSNSKKTKLSSKKQNPKEKNTQVSRSEQILLDGKHSKLLGQLQPALKTEMTSILNSEDKIVKLLGIKKNMDTFVNDPAKFFREAKIDLRPSVRKRLETFQIDSIVQQRKFILPNGQSISPKLFIHIKTQ